MSRNGFLSIMWRFLRNLQDGKLKRFFLKCFNNVHPGYETLYCAKFDACLPDVYLYLHHHHQSTVVNYWCLQVYSSLPKSAWSTDFVIHFLFISFHLFIQSSNIIMLENHVNSFQILQNYNGLNNDVFGQVRHNN